jgi:hypothetical protein
MLRPENFKLDMRALDQFRRFFATIAGGVAGVRQSSGLNREDRERNEQRALPPDDKRNARTMQIARDDEERARPPSGSYPAVWPH